MTGWAEDLLLGGGYVLLALLILLENLFPPIPSELLLPLAGSRVASGDFDYLGAVAAATIGSVAGALILYSVGRFGGRRCCCATGGSCGSTSAGWTAPTTGSTRTAPSSCCSAAWSPACAASSPCPPGLSEMPVGRFVALTALGSALWNAVLIGAGWALGSRWREATELVERADVWVYVAVVAASRPPTARTGSGARTRTPELPEVLDHLGVALLAGAEREHLHPVPT